MSAVPETRPLLDDADLSRIERELQKYPAERRQSAVIFALAIIQDKAGWVSPQAIEEVANYLGMPPIAVHEVASFYGMFNIRPIGKYRISVCTCLPCELRHGSKAAAYLKEKLGVEFDETTSDGLFTIKESECLGSCGDAPVLLVNNKRMCSFMDNGKLDALIDELRAAE